MNELQYTKAFQASIYRQQSMLPLQCKKKTDVYFMPILTVGQWDLNSTMYADMYTWCKGAVMQSVCKIDTLKLARQK